MSTTNKQGEIRLTVRDRIATIEFFHPANNSLPGKLLSDLANAIRTAGEDPAAGVLVLRSAGDRTFCAGASITELAEIGDVAAGKRFFLGFARVINAMRTSPKIILARVQGKAVGGGVGLAAAADHCLATRWASIRLSELALGIGPFVIGPAVTRKMGVSAYSQLALDANNWQSAEWACTRGLYAGVYETVEEMDQALDGLARTLAGYPPEALQQLKQVCWEGTEHWERLLDERAAISGELVRSPFTREAIASFRSKSRTDT
ncbi:MAG: hypothetical protein RLY31_1856 [Bacteroidota bacterium]|jgi:methylglutaconyl-CoA hydratase